MDKFHILVVDDNPAIHVDFKKILCPSHEDYLAIETLQAALLGKVEQKSESAYLIDSAYQGEEALALIQKGLAEKRHYAIAFVDVRMPPGMDGIETAKRIWELDLNIQVVICTAYSDYSWDELMTRFGINDRLLILKKPFENIEVQ